MGSTLIFADIEASGLGLESYPIEVGWAWVHRNRVQVRDILIRPSKEWLARSEAWTAEAEALHGLSLQRLIAEGADTKEVCLSLNGAWRGKELHFDTGCDAHDSRWLGQLYRAADLTPSYSLSHLSSDEAILALARRRAVPDRVLLELDRLAPKLNHRAATDAAHWAWWQLAIDRLTDGGAANCKDLSGEALAAFIDSDA